MDERETPMDAQCTACLRGPSKIDGHADLIVRRLGLASIVFQCRSCGLLWSRSYSGNNDFSWLRLDRTAQSVAVGVAVPVAASP
jgi:hypothetical protein